MDCHPQNLSVHTLMWPEITCTVALECKRSSVCSAFMQACNILYKSHFVQLLESVWRCLDNLYRYPNYSDSQVKVCCSSSTAVMCSGFWLFCFVWGYALSDPVATRRPEYSTWSIKWYVHRMEIFSACLGVSSLTVFYNVQWTFMFLPWNLRGHNDICPMVDLAEPWSVYIHS
jgi:hypothetical protein